MDFLNSLFQTELVAALAAFTGVDHQTCEAVAITVATALGVALVAAWFTSDKLQHVPGPPTKLFGDTPIDPADIAHSIRQYSKEYGTTYRLKVGGESHVVVLDPKDLRKVFVSEWAKFDRGLHMYSDDTAGAAMGPHSLEVVKNDEWIPMRSVMNKVFQGDWMHRTVDLCNEKSVAFINKVTNDSASGATAVDIVPMMQHVSLDILTAFMYSKDWDSLGRGTSKIMDAVLYGMNHIMYRNTVTIPYWRWFKTAEVKTFDSYMDFIYSLTDDVLAERERNGYNVSEDQKDMLAIMHEAYQAGEMTMTQLRDNARMMFNAADTTPAGMSWLVYYLAKHQDVQDKLRDELNEVMGDRQDITYDDLKEMRYLNMCVKETLRMKPPVRAFQSRHVKEDTVLGGYKVPKGSHIALCMYATQHLESQWSDPDTFNPDRFSYENSKGRDALAWIPFLGGRRNCWGMRFADVEVKLVAARLVRNHRLILENKTEPGGIVSFVYHPTDVRVFFKPL
eukprot:GFYU01002717.1.p1 GENE.GFYU01002717.1~~GFYU01002717.1.p1  ORF type:complete len:506 (-),score=169.54 GFYU01002717.1:156-1673(-)